MRRWRRGGGGVALGDGVVVPGGGVGVEIFFYVVK